MGKVHYLFSLYKEQGKAEGDVTKINNIIQLLYDGKDLNSVYSEIHALILVLHFLPWHLPLLSYNISSVHTSQPTTRISHLSRNQTKCYPSLWAMVIDFV